MEISKRVLCGSTFSFIFSLVVILSFVNLEVFQIRRMKAPLPTRDAPKLAPRDSQEEEKEAMEFLLSRLVRGQQWEEFLLAGFACQSELDADMCISSKQMRFDTNSSKVYIASENQTSQQYIVRPYALKRAGGAMETVKPVEILFGNANLPACDYIHDEPAMVFSSGGYTGNMNHEFSDLLIPLFVTIRHFRSRVKLVVTDFRVKVLNRYRKFFGGLSRYEVINATAGTGNGGVHCFPGGIVGLKHHGIMTLNETDVPGGHSMSEFREFLANSYGLKAKDVSQLLHRAEKPRLLLIPRNETRRILNKDEVMKTAADLGLQVVAPNISLMSNLDEFALVINSCSVMVGFHGAGLTNSLFLPDGAVMIQVLGLNLDWAANAYYGAPAQTMGLQYLEYRAEPQESSLYELYGADDPVITDPKIIDARGYQAFRDVYLIQQDVRINVQRFRDTLVHAMRLVGRRSNGSSSPLN